MQQVNDQSPPRSPNCDPLRIRLLGIHTQSVRETYGIHMVKFAPNPAFLTIRSVCPLYKWR